MGHAVIVFIKEQLCLNMQNKGYILRGKVSQQLSFFSPPPRPKLPSLVGYVMCASHPITGSICTYREARSLDMAFNLCLEEFPVEEGYELLTVQNQDTMVKTILPQWETT